MQSFDLNFGFEKKEAYGYNEQAYNSHGYMSPPPEIDEMNQYGMRGGSYGDNEHSGLPSGLAKSGGEAHRPSSNRDAVGQHLLYETAMMDSQQFEILDISEIDALKKEQIRLNSRIEGVQRKLALETKVKDAAQNLQRLYQNKSKSRPDTPQSPDSPKRSRSSLLGNRASSERGSGGSEGASGSLVQAEGELAASVRKVDELHVTVKGLIERRQQVERALLRHTAAVLAEQASANAKSPNADLPNGHVGADLGHSISNGPDGFDDIRDILQGMPMGASNKSQAHEKQMADVKSRLEQLNGQLENVLAEGNRTLGQSSDRRRSELQDDSSSSLDSLFARLQDSAKELEHQQSNIKEHHDRSEVDKAIEEQMQGLNQQLHNVLLIASETQPLPDLERPPQPTGRGYQDQMQYLEDSLLTMEQLLQQHSQALESARDASIDVSRSTEQALEKAEADAKRVGEYDAVLQGLWDILQSDVQIRRPSFNPEDGSLGRSSSPNPGLSPLKESFSIQAFNSHVQHLFDRAQSAKEQQDILRRQVQQQRELNGKSDAEKDRELSELQERHEELVTEHRTVQEELAAAWAKHQEASTEAAQANSELSNVMSEFDSLKTMIESRQKERDTLSRELKEHHVHASELQDQIDQLEAELADASDDTKLASAEASARATTAEQQSTELASQLATAETRSTTLQSELQTLEAEVVRLTTELTMAKAELDGAYGTRAERKGAQAAEVDALSGRNKEIENELSSLRTENTALVAEADALRQSSKSSGHAAQLERELQEMTNEFQGLTRESIEMEKEREQLDGLIDGLRERCEELEAQLSDAKVMQLGVRGLDPRAEPEAVGKEQMSTMVLKHEFKRMMRDTRAEGIKALRVEQEERRRLESELRKMRQGLKSPRAGADASNATPT